MSDGDEATYGRRAIEFSDGWPEVLMELIEHVVLTDWLMSIQNLI